MDAPTDNAQNNVQQTDMPELNYIDSGITQKIHKATAHLTPDINLHTHESPLSVPSGHNSGSDSRVDKQLHASLSVPASFIQTSDISDISDTSDISEKSYILYVPSSAAHHQDLPINSLQYHLSINATTQDIHIDRQYAVPVGKHTVTSKHNFPSHISVSDQHTPIPSHIATHMQEVEFQKDDKITNDKLHPSIIATAVTNPKTAYPVPAAINRATDNQTPSMELPTEPENMAKTISMAAPYRSGNISMTTVKAASNTPGSVAYEFSEHTLQHDRPNTDTHSSDPLMHQILAGDLLSKKLNHKGITLGLGNDEVGSSATISKNADTLPLSPVEKNPEWAALISSVDSKELHVSKKVSINKDVSAPHQRQLRSMGPLPKN